MTIENMQFKVNDKLEKRISSLERNNKNHETTNKILTSLLVVLYGESKLTSKTDNEKKAVVLSSLLLFLSRFDILFSSLSLTLNCIFSIAIFFTSHLKI